MWIILRDTRSSCRREWRNPFLTSPPVPNKGTSLYAHSLRESASYFPSNRKREKSLRNGCHTVSGMAGGRKLLAGPLPLIDESGGNMSVPGRARRPRVLGEARGESPAGASGPGPRGGNSCPDANLASWRVFHEVGNGMQEADSDLADGDCSPLIYWMGH